MTWLISYKDHVTKEEVSSRTQDAVGVHDVLLTMVRLRWYDRHGEDNFAGDSERNTKARKTEDMGSQINEWT